jgi:hypothetical protein
MNRFKNFLRHHSMRPTMNRTIVFSLLLTLLVAVPSWAATWYVSQNGAGSKNGTSVENAWQNPSGVGSIYNNWGSSCPDASKVCPGDTVKIIGTLTEGFEVRGSGTSGNYITITQNSSGAAIRPSSGSALSIDGQSWIKVTDLTINSGVNVGFTSPSTHCVWWHHMDMQWGTGRGIPKQFCKFWMQQHNGQLLNHSKRGEWYIHDLVLRRSRNSALS